MHGKSKSKLEQYRKNNVKGQRDAKIKKKLPCAIASKKFLCYMFWFENDQPKLQRYIIWHTYSRTELQKFGNFW
jgi:hypothetical protein